MNTIYLDPPEIEAAARQLGCDVATVLAVRDVEAGPRGFAPDLRPLILYEGHVFSRRTGGRFDASHPHLSWPAWDRAKYLRDQPSRWRQWEAAAALDRVAAIEATSYGLFQVMGFNARLCGFIDAEDYHQAMHRDEAEHLRAFLGYVLAWQLDDELRRKDWAGFALGYNGPRAAENRYAEKLARAYARHGGAGRAQP